MTPSLQSPAVHAETETSSRLPMRPKWILRQRGGRSLSRVAGAADDGALGYRRPGGVANTRESLLADRRTTQKANLSSSQSIG